MVDGDVFCISEAADAAELAAARVARKKTNKRPCCRGACQDTLLTLPSNMLPMLRLLYKKRWLLLRRLPSQADKDRARI